MFNLKKIYQSIKAKYMLRKFTKDAQCLNKVELHKYDPIADYKTPKELATLGSPEIAKHIPNIRVGYKPGYTE